VKLSHLNRVEFTESFNYLYNPFTLLVYPWGKYEIHKRRKGMKKILVVALLVVIALGVYTGVASAQTAQPQTGTLHDYMEKALAEKLGLPVATVESQFDAGKSLYQIALDNRITQADLPAFMLDVRTQALKAAVADGVITQAQADRMTQRGGRGIGMGNVPGTGMMNGSGRLNGGTAPCNGTGIPVGSGMQRGNRWQQTNP
jgi:hypothetical protein